MAEFKFRDVSDKANRKTSKRSKRFRSYKVRASLGSPSSAWIKRTQKGKRIENGFPAPGMAYDDVLEVSRLTEVLLKGGDVSKVASPSKAAKRYIMRFSRDNKGSHAAENLYHRVNKQLVLMNRGENHPTSASVKLYRDLMSDKASAE